LLPLLQQEAAWTSTISTFLFTNVWLTLTTYAAVAVAAAGGRLDLEDTSLQPAAAEQGGAAGTTQQQQQQQQVSESEAVQQYRRRRQEVLDLIPTVFADTDEQYASLAAVKAKLEGFKAQYPKEYATAYIGESAAALFAPFVRLELLQWEPLPLVQQQQIGGSSNGSAADGQTQQQQQQQAAGFDTQDWYQQLFEYGLAAAGPAAAAAAAGDDADANLVPQLVESLVLPLALSLVAR
jgi:GC-rich sequence DNA-binding factor